ncbi:hypothetical protein [Phenylobacterium sp.]|uniref:hypothetical protein n=1 Tax=Phenylobacterium sp. TaxID=1871053 RepID=UPI002ED9531B
MTDSRLSSVMDGVFGRGAWRMTGGYRTPERENQLRAQGAKTVRPGGTSRHSLGRPGAPGAYDVVVDGMSPAAAAERLRRAGAPFARYQPKGAHGNQGPHLHLEPYGYGSSSRRFRGELWTVSAGSVVAEGPAKALVITLPAATPRTLAWFRKAPARSQDDTGAVADTDEITALLKAEPARQPERHAGLKPAVD